MISWENIRDSCGKNTRLLGEKDKTPRNIFETPWDSLRFLSGEHSRLRREENIGDIPRKPYEITENR